MIENADDEVQPVGFVNGQDLEQMQQYGGACLLLDHQQDGGYVPLYTGPMVKLPQVEPFSERWYGSGKEHGWWLVRGREHVAHLGPDINSHAVTRLLDALNLLWPRWLPAAPAPLPARLVKAVREVLRISDRQHVAWDEAKAALAEFEAGQPAAQNQAPAEGDVLDFVRKFVTYHYTDEPEQESLIDEAWRILQCDGARTLARSDELNEKAGMPHSQALELAISEGCAAHVQPKGTVVVSLDLIRRAQQAINWHLEPNSPDEYERTMLELSAIGWPEEHALVEAVLATDQQAQAPAPAHGDDIAVDEFAAAMKAKLADARAKGRHGWQTCSQADLTDMLHEHVAKGDPRDVANFCMFLWKLGHGIKPVSGYSYTESMAYAEGFQRGYAQAPAVVDGAVGKMTAQRSKFFLERFKREEKLLGPNEQAGLNYAIAALEREQYAKPLSDDEKARIVRNWFAEDWAIDKALGMLDDYDLAVKRSHVFHPPVQGSE